MGIVGPRRAFWNAQAIRIEQRAFARHDKADIGIVGHHLRNIAIIFNNDIDVAGGQ